MMQTVVMEINKFAQFVQFVENNQNIPRFKLL